jgi:hypothetical protein
MIETEQKLIRIGSSEGVTLSRKDLAKLGARRGDMLKLKVELSDSKQKFTDLKRDYDNFVRVYGQTLKNLANK